jgi:hypothetical protein
MIESGCLRPEEVSMNISLEGCSVVVMGGSPGIELASACLFLMTNPFVTGAVPDVDGGGLL